MINPYKSQPSPANSLAGFTLLEVLLSLAIFTIIGISTVKQLQLIASTKATALEDLDFYNEVRAFVGLLRGDLSQAFHIRFDDLSSESQAAIRQGQPVPHTLFDGRKNELILTSLSHRLFYADRHECEQTEISYFLQKKNGHSSPSLMKRESEIIDGDLFRGGSVHTIIDDVQTLEFKYWDDKQDKWVDDWSSDNGSTVDRFPFAVKVHIGLKTEKGKALEFETQFKVAFPNNEKEFARL